MGYFNWLLCKIVQAPALIKVDLTKRNFVNFLYFLEDAALFRCSVLKSRNLAGMFSTVSFVRKLTKKENLSPRYSSPFIDYFFVLPVTMLNERNFNFVHWH